MVTFSTCLASPCETATANSSNECSVRFSNERAGRTMTGMTRKGARAVRDWLRSHRNNGEAPPVGRMRFGALRRTDPVSQVWGFDRGHVIDRYYIEQFLSQHAGDIRGHVLEIAGDFYTRRFGGDRVTGVD